jgi:hypothetical protein
MGSDVAHLLDQFGTPDRLLIHARTHQQYSAKRDTWIADIVEHLQVAPGQRLLDADRGNGGMHAALRSAGAEITGIDHSSGHGPRGA